MPGKIWLSRALPYWGWARMRPPRGPRRVLWVVEVIKSAAGYGTGVEAGGDQPGNMGHIHHEIGLYFPGNFGKAVKIKSPRISAGPGDDHFGAVLPGHLRHHGKIDFFGLAIHPVGDGLEQASGKIHCGAVAQMAAMGQIHAQDGITRFKEGKIDGHIGLGAGMGLHIGIGSPEELFDPA